MAGRLISRIGLGPAIIGGIVLIAASDLILPLVGGPPLVVVMLLIASQFFFGIGLTTYNIGQVTLRQAITPNHLQGRMNATMRVALVGTIPIGALVGGVLGDAIDLRATLFVAVVGEFLAVMWLIFSPVMRIREQPR